MSRQRKSCHASAQCPQDTRKRLRESSLYILRRMDEPFFSLSSFSFSHLVDIEGANDNHLWRLHEISHRDWHKCADVLTEDIYVKLQDSTNRNNWRLVCRCACITKKNRENPRKELDCLHRQTFITSSPLSLCHAKKRNDLCVHRERIPPS